MKILFLDDSVERHKEICQNKNHDFDNGVYFCKFKEHEIDHCLSAITAIGCLALHTEGYDVVYLDHDLGEDEDSGMSVVRYIIGMPKWYKPKKIIVHSVNVPMATKMVAELKSYNIDAVKMPFTSMIN